MSVATHVYASLAEVEAYSQFEAGSRVRSYLQVGQVLHRDYPGATLLTSEIGALGYSFQGYVIDGAGLASPAVLRYHPLSIPSQRDSGLIGGIPPEMVRVSNPDLIVSYDVFAEALLNDPVLGDYVALSLPAQLEDVRRCSHTGLVWGSRHLRVYLRRGLAVSDALAAPTQ